jgi:hypothetical protein
VPGKETRHDFEAHKRSCRAHAHRRGCRLRRPSVHDHVERHDTDGRLRGDHRLDTVDDVGDHHLHSHHGNVYIRVRTGVVNHLDDVRGPVRGCAGGSEHNLAVRDPDEQLRQRLPGPGHPHGLRQPGARQRQVPGGLLLPAVPGQRTGPVHPSAQLVDDHDVVVVDALIAPR